jgi:heme/copper-type cytochrome/quinol oxidase subunit 1
MPRRVYTYPAELGLGSMNLVATVGAMVLGFSTLILVFNVWYSSRKGEKADKNPWGAATLEWAVSSPPPVYNFSVLPEVSSRLPLWTVGGMNDIPDEPPEPVHVPGGSYWPAVTALGLVLFFTGALVQSLWFAVASAVLLAVSAFKWAFEPFEM